MRPVFGLTSPTGRSESILITLVKTNVIPYGIKDALSNICCTRT